MSTWRAILIVYRELDVCLERDRLHHVATEDDIADAVRSFRAFPALAAALTDSAARVEAREVMSGEPLRSLSAHGKGAFWPSPADTRRELDAFAPAGSCDSIFVLWPKQDFVAKTGVPGGAWGYGMGASDWTNGATYAAVTTAPTTSWTNEALGEVWLHEWLHGVCDHFARRGHAMPTRDADGADGHGYVRSAENGWTDYYRDLMSGRVQEDGRALGIPIAAWAKALA
jgi:hypothetical protein